ncbi:Ca2+-binding RTX toxin-like protein [Rhizobium azooxidifex]|uniref:Ca2+-binding RTX toxin-like protein n=1 Tax=Mycoplana azooxidifex TaxID=1636188 RepID=A0A7W6D443_9HYPH|nr:calcium-binding protein [Mycoplana azooxidifex]MBB3976418.1 Ca2+-binding RTX toxin-like protein [Mycoplana azooxidifex]
MATIYIERGTSAAKIESLIKDAAAGSVIQFRAGTYTFEDKVQIARSDITILGAGVGKTNIVVDAKGTKNATAFDIQGGKAIELKAELTTTTVKGSTVELKLSSVAGISKGAILQLQQENDRKWLDSQGNQHVSLSKDPLREMLAEVVAVDAAKGTVTLASKTPYNFEKGKTTISVVNVVKDIELGGFSIKTNLGKADGLSFTNKYYDKYNNASTVEVTSATDVKLHNISLMDNASHGFSFSAVYGITGDRLTTAGSHNKGGEGNGYAFHLKHAFNNTFTNLTDTDMRHSVLFGSWSAEHYNRIGVLYTNRDINFHGSPDDGNTVYVEQAVLSFSSQYAHGGVSPGSPRVHPNATIEANNVKFKYFTGSSSQDKIRGADTGSVLIGNGDIDELTGGKGNDRLSGGTDDDILRGNAGADTFVFARSFDKDTVRDFVKSDKDKIDLSGTGITNLSDLARRQVGSDTVIALGGGDELVLKGVKVGDLGGSQFTFSKALSTGVTITMLGEERGATGTNRNDVIKVAPGYLGDDKLHIVGGAGTDTLQVIKGSGIDLRLLGRLDGVEVVDMTKTPSSGTLTLNKKVATQGDSDYLTVKIDGTGAKLKTTDITDWDLVRIVGTGVLKLDNSGAYLSAGSGAKLNVAGGTGADHVKGGSSKDKILGGSGNDVIQGGGGNDRLEGGSGNDRITGGKGADILTGNSGADRFVFTSAKDSTSSARDTITDFWRSHKDKIDVSAIDARADKSGNQSFKFIGDKAFSGTDGQLRAKKSGDGTMISGDINGDKKADFSTFVDQVVTFKDADFIL